MKKQVLQKITLTAQHRKLRGAEAKRYRQPGIGVDEVVVSGAGRTIRVGVAHYERPGAHMKPVRLWALRKLADRFGVSISIRDKKPGRAT